MTPQNICNTPSKYITHIYGAKAQYDTKYETQLSSAKQCANIKKITGYVLYYARAVYPTVIMPLNDITT
jgi:hypothetical protein